MFGNRKLSRVLLDELVELNQAHIQDEIDEMKNAVRQDTEKYLRDLLKKTLKKQ